MIINKTIADKVNAQLIQWFRENKRDLLFRQEKNPYKIWISEIMAQQTQIDTLLPYYERFIAAFPTVEALAQADPDAVLKLWEGLGYYSRAKNLKKTAELIRHSENFPNHFEDLKKDARNRSVHSRCRREHRF